MTRKYKLNPNSNAMRARRLLTKSRLKKLYISQKKSQGQIAKMYKVSKGTVRDQMRLHNIKVRTADQLHRKYKKIDLDKFNKIDNKDLAYVLGYLAWAGTITKGKYGKNQYNMESFHISVKESDKGYLDILKKRLGINNKSHFYKTTVNNSTWGRYGISISQKGIKKALSKWYYREGFDIKKFPPKMPKKYLPIYLQGYFERHGCVVKHKLQIGLVGEIATMSGPSYKFVKELQQCLKENGVVSELLVTKYTYKKQKPGYRVRVVTHNMVEFLNFIYEGDTRKGTRRKNDLIEAVKYWRPRKDRLVTLAENRRKLSKNKTWIRRMRQTQGLSNDKISEKLNTSKGQVYSFVKKHGIKSKKQLEREVQHHA